MIDAELADYVKKTRGKFNAKLLREKLSTAGWRKEDIDEVLGENQTKKADKLSFSVARVVMAVVGIILLFAMVSSLYFKAHSFPWEDSASPDYNYQPLSQSLPTALPEIPYTGLAQATFVEAIKNKDCAWTVFIHLKGFTPNSQISVRSDARRFTKCDLKLEDYSWQSNQWGSTDEYGASKSGFYHEDFGTYHYVFTDATGKTAEVTFSYPNSAE